MRRLVNIVDCSGRIETYPLGAERYGVIVKCELHGEVAGVEFNGMFSEEAIRNWARETWLRHLSPVIDFQI